MTRLINSPKVRGTMPDDDVGLPGYGLLDPASLMQPEFDSWTAADWNAEFVRTREQLTTFLRVRDPYAILAKSSMRHMIESGMRRAPSNSRVLPNLEQGEIEFLQALLLAQAEPPHRGPTSPANFERLWLTLNGHVASFVHKQAENADDKPIQNMISQRARLHTIYYRNLFTRKDCEATLQLMLQPIDALAEQELGYKLTAAFRALVRVCDIVTERLETFSDRRRILMTTTDRHVVLDTIAFFEGATPLAARLWQRCVDRFDDIEALRSAGYQLSEMANAWIYTLPRALLVKEFAPEAVAIIDRLSLRHGDLAQENPEHLYMNNPVWRRPYIALENGDLFAALPQLIFSFPFLIIESLIAGHSRIEKAYENVRAAYLEEAIASIVRRAMPCASVYERVYWIDPDTGKVFENDVVALIGNTIFLFEAKSGRIKDAARRGGLLSLETNFKELFIAPGEQAWRLQNYLDTHGSKVSLRLKANGEAIDLHLDRKKQVYKFSICIEHFASLTSAKYYLRELGLVTNETAWAPILSLGELLMIDRFLDTEISFFHYLTRRATLEELIDFHGDEQDLLSMYLTNGLCIDPAAIAGRKVFFQNADDMVRKPHEPRSIRTEFEVYGVKLSPMWSSIVQEIYQEEQLPHRFDIIQTILNQSPPALFDFERRIRRWKRGVSAGGQDVLISRYEVGHQLFAVAVHLMKHAPDADTWMERSRDIATAVARTMGATDCAVFLKIRRSKEKTFDGVSFFRMGARPAPGKPN